MGNTARLGRFTRPEGLPRRGNNLVSEEQLSLFGTDAVPKYSDSEFMTSKEKEKAFRCFARILKERDINMMDHNLYEHLHLHCGFIAHYNISGFKGVYSGQGFRAIVAHFDRNHKDYCWLIVRGEYADVNRDMVELATVMAPQIYAELDAQKKATEIYLCKVLAGAHGLRVLGA